MRTRPLYWWLLVPVQSACVMSQEHTVTGDDHATPSACCLHHPALEDQTGYLWTYRRSHDALGHLLLQQGICGQAPSQITSHILPTCTEAASSALPSLRAGSVHKPWRTLNKCRSRLSPWPQRAVRPSALKKTGAEWLQVWAK